MRDCEASGQSFGILGIESGGETGRWARPFNVGTLASIREVERLEDGRYNVSITGATRFRVRELSLEHPYLSGRVDLLTESGETGPEVEAMARSVTPLFVRYVTALRTLSGHGGGEVAPPSDPELLSYLVAGTLQVDPRQKQLMLETDSVTTRLRTCRYLLRREVVFTEKMLTRRDPRLAMASVLPN